MQMSLVMSMRFNFGDDLSDVPGSHHDVISLEFSCNYTRVQPATADVNTRTKSDQKQIVEYNIKSKHPEEYSTAHKVGSEKPLASKSCFA